MGTELPQFRYHPDPYKTGAVVGAEVDCECCGEGGGPFYSGPFYAVDAVEFLCLGCVSSGRAAEAFDGEFVDAANFEQGAVSEAVIAEVTRRTPSYSAWQQEQWLVHCGDACAFLGYPSGDEIADAASETIAEWCERSGLPREAWDTTCSAFADGQTGFYKFGCLGCGMTLFATDWN